MEAREQHSGKQNSPLGWIVLLGILASLFLWAVLCHFGYPPVRSLVFSWVANGLITPLIAYLVVYRPLRERDRSRELSAFVVAGASAASSRSR